MEIAVIYEKSLLKDNFCKFLLIWYSSTAQQILNDFNRFMSLNLKIIKIEHIK